MAFDAGQVKGGLTFDASSFDKAGKQILTTQSQITKKTGLAGAAFGGMWKQVAAGVGVTNLITSGIRAIGDQITDTIQKGREFETEWANVTTMISDASVNTDKLRDELLNLSPTLGSTTELARGMYQTLSASIEPAKAIEFLGEAAKSAKAGITTTATAVDALSTVINAYGMEADAVTQVSDVMFQTVKRGKLNYEELATSLGTVVPVAAQTGVSFQEVAASIASLTRQGIDAATATMQLRQVLMAVLKPSKEAQDVAGALGLELGANALKTKGLVGWLKELKEKTGGSADAIAKIVPNARSLTAVMALAGDRIDEVTGDLDLMNKAFATGGQTQEAFQKQMQSASFWLDAGKEAIDKIKISFYLGIVEPFKEGITSADDLDKATKELTETFRDLGEIVGTVLKATVGVLGKQFEIWSGHIRNIKMVTGHLISKIKGEQVPETKRLIDTQSTLNQIGLATVGIQKEVTDATDKSTNANKGLNEATSSTSAIWEELSKKIGKTKEELTAYEQFIKDNAIMTIAEKSKKIDELKEILEKLHQEYKDGKLDYQTYMDAVDNVKGKIEELSTTLRETAVPAARDLSQALAEAPGEVSRNTQTAIIEIGKSGNEITNIFGQVSERIRDKWTTELGAMLSGATSFKDGLNSVWQTIKQQFFDLCAQLITKFTLQVVGGILSGAAKAGQGLLGSIGGALSNLFGGGGGAGATGGIGGLLGGLGGATLPGMIASGIGGLLGGMLSGGGDKHYLKGIKDQTWAIMMDMRNAVTNQDFLKERADWTWSEIKHANEQLNDIKKSNWEISKETGKMKNTLWRIEKLFGSIKSAQYGYTSTSEDMVFIHGSPHNPEHVIPDAQIEDIINLSALYGAQRDAGLTEIGQVPGGGRGGGGGAPREIKIEVNSEINLNGLIVTDREHTREKLIPEIIAAFNANINKVEFLEALDLSNL